MKTLIFFIPEDEEHKRNTHKDFTVEGNILRVIYHKKKMNIFSFLLFKRKLLKLTDGAHMFACDISKRMRGNIVWRDGYSLALYHLKQIVFTAIDSSEKEDIAVFSTNPQDIALFTEIIMSCDVKILTFSDLVQVYNKIMHEEFGLVGSAAAALPMEGKTVVIMPGGEIFRAEAAANIINLSKAEIPWRCITPLSVRFAVPDCLKPCAHVLSRSDALQTAMDFFGIDYDKTHVVSVKTDKEQ